MPHKKNPILAERLCGLSRVMRGYLQASFEDTALWHERDISHSSVERIIFPDAFNLVHYMLKKTLELIKNANVNDMQIRRNIKLTEGKIYSQKILSWLIDNGMTRSKAYDIVQDAAKTESFRGTLFQKLPSDIKKKLMKDYKKVFSPKEYTKKVKHIYIRMKKYEETKCQD